MEGLGFLDLGFQGSGCIGIWGFRVSAFGLLGLGVQGVHGFWIWVSGLRPFWGSGFLDLGC